MLPGSGRGALGPPVRTGDPHSLRGPYVFPAQPGGHGLCPGLGSQPCARCPLCRLGTPIGDCRITGPATKVPLTRHLHPRHTHTHTRFLQSHRHKMTKTHTGIPRHTKIQTLLLFWRGHINTIITQTQDHPEMLAHNLSPQTHKHAHSHRAIPHQ